MFLVDTKLSETKIFSQKNLQLLYEAGLYTINDLLTLYPKKYVDRKTVTKIGDLYKRLDDDGNIKGDVNLIVRVAHKNIMSVRKKQILNVTFTDSSGFINGVWFVYAHFYNKKLQSGKDYLLSGRVNYKGKWEISHPEFEVVDQEKFEGAIIPLYPIKGELKLKGLDSHYMRGVVEKVLSIYLERVEELIPERVRDRYKLTNIDKALKAIHFPDSNDQKKEAIRRVKFDELFFFQASIISKKIRYRSIKSEYQISDSGLFLERFLLSLPFELTTDQKGAIKDIYKDFRSPSPMNRLVQGDVGSGKTIVALATILMMVGNGYQCAIMAPTEILAEQHYRNFKTQCEIFDINISLLTGKMRKSVKDEALNNIANGVTDIAIGTHALFQKDVQFSSLGYVVIDEQHRFGVAQRGGLIDKGDSTPHILVMTATPIPRTITLSLYGDLDLTLIKEMPKGRKSVKTAIRDSRGLDKIYTFMKSEIDEGRKIYIIYPLVEKSEKSDLSAAVDQFSKLKETVFKDYKIALLHGKMRSGEKDEIMKGFKGDQYDLLISTTVVEVGVDVKEASVILIMHSERFGLAQLHQLRGRVGRSDIQSYCILHHSDTISDDSLDRLKVMEESSDGFELSEKDFEIRGPGEFFGERQSGVTDLKLVNLLYDRRMIFEVRKVVEELLYDDPLLSKYPQLRDYINSRYSDKIDILNY
jgi:ATP-dependent DNA helicase RecG